MALNLLLDRVTGTCTTTDGTTWVSVLEYTPPINSVSRFQLFIAGKDASNNAAAFAGEGCISRTIGNLTLVGSAGSGGNYLSAPFIASTVTSRIQVTGAVLEIQVRGLAATTIEWFCEMQIRVA